MRLAVPLTLTLTLLAACAAPPDRDVSVRHFPSTAFHDGTRFHVFVFDPDEPRSLNTRIRLARGQINAEPGCRWREVPTSVIEDATRRQGDQWADRLLAAPVDCSA
jgi:hypothetical protein